MDADWDVPRERITVLHPGVDTSKFSPAAPDPAGRARLGWTGRRVVLTVGALQKRKGQDMMIRALPAIGEPVPGRALRDRRRGLGTPLPRTAGG